jgi:hypothetical protein
MSIIDDIEKRKKGADVRIVRSAIPSTPLPTVDEIPQVPDSFKQRDEEWKKFDEDLKSWWRRTRRFLLEQMRLINDNID